MLRVCSLLVGLNLVVSCKSLNRSDADSKLQTDGNASSDIENGWLNSWDFQARKDWYLLPQGSHLLDYEIFIKLRAAQEQGTPEDWPLISSRQVLEPFGFVYPNPNQAGHFTIDGLPFGMVIDEYKGDLDTPTSRNLFIEKQKYLGYNCAACHTSHVKIDGKRFIVEGGGSNTLDQKKFFEP